MSNDRFIIPEPGLPIASKRRVTHYTRVTTKEKQTWLMPSTINQTNKVLLRAKMLHICGVHLGLLPQTSLGGFCLWVISISISISSFLKMALASVLIPYVLNGLLLSSGVHV